MPILDSELLWYRAALGPNDTTPASNGGRVNLAAEIVSGAANNLFPNVSRAQRADGVEHWRKCFLAVRNAANLTLIDPLISIESGTPGDSYVLLHAGTQDDTEDDVTARPYGYATLAEDAALAAETIVVTVEHADYEAMSPNPFQVGDLIRIDARADVTAEGDVDYRVIDSVLYDEDELTIGLTVGLDHAYTAADGVHVASVLQADDVVAAVSGVSVTNQAQSTLDYDETNGNLACAAIGAIRQVWTVTVTDGTSGALSVSGDTLGAVGTGALGAQLAPANPRGGVYFTLKAVGWSGTAKTGDTLVFETTPAAIPLWYHRIVPAGAESISSDPFSVCIEAESA